MGKNLTKKEADFCCLAASLGNAAEAAYKAGFTVLPQRKAEKLMRKKQISDEILKIKEKNAQNEEALTGLRRIAFGSVADAVNLAVNFDSDSGTDTHSLDLFSVSEIKYTSGKGVEIKFYDRLKALGMLLDAESVKENAGVLSIYEALSRSAGQASEYE